jgi:hypothetical protein
MSVVYTPSSSNGTLPHDSNGGLTALILGCSIGGTFFLIVLIGVVILFLRRRRSDSGGSFSYASSLYSDSDSYSKWDRESETGCSFCCCCNNDDSREGRFISNASSSYLEI